MKPKKKFVKEYHKDHNHCGALYPKEEGIHLTVLEEMPPS